MEESEMLSTNSPNFQRKRRKQIKITNNQPTLEITPSVNNLRRLSTQFKDQMEKLACSPIKGDDIDSLKSLNSYVAPESSIRQSPCQRDINSYQSYQNQSSSYDSENKSQANEANKSQIFFEQNVSFKKLVFKSLYKKFRTGSEEEKEQVKQYVTVKKDDQLFVKKKTIIPQDLNFKDSKNKYHCCFIYYVLSFSQELFHQAFLNFYVNFDPQLTFT